MKVEYINPFIEASRIVINQILGTEPTVGKPYIKTTPYTSENVVTIIGVTGVIRGNVVVAFSRETVFAIASTMMGGMPVQELDEMTKSAIAELCNMILGNTATILSKNNLSIDITPPTVLTGDNLEFSPTKGVVICIPLNLENGATIEININNTN